MLRMLSSREMWNETGGRRRWPVGWGVPTSLHMLTPSPGSTPIYPQHGPHNNNTQQSQSWQPPRILPRSTTVRMCITCAGAIAHLHMCARVHRRVQVHYYWGSEHMAVRVLRLCVCVCAMIASLY